MRAAPENKAETTSREHELAIRRPPKTSDPASDCNCLTVRGPCAPGLVAGRYQPLADDVTIAGDVRPNLSSAVGSEDKAKRALDACKRRFASASTPKRVAATRRPSPALCHRESTGFARDSRVTASAEN